jgi:LysM repeat protein
LLSRQTLLRVVAIGVAVGFAACENPSRHSTKSDRAKTKPTSTTVAPAAPTTVPPIAYPVKRGDTLTAIARFFGVSSASILAANQLANGDRLTEGQVLQIPHAPPPQLTVAPPDAPPGTEFKFTVTSAKAGENVIFQIERPDGSKFSGSPHAASQDGTVMASYNSSGDGPGTYNVVATGDRGTTVQASYRLLG